MEGTSQRKGDKMALNNDAINDLVDTLRRGLDPSSNAQFLRKMASWITKYYGNVTVAVRLQIIGETMRVNKGKK